LFFQFECLSMTMRVTKGSEALALAAHAARGDMARTERIIRHLCRCEGQVGSKLTGM
jgi:hypothetical protein